MDSSVISSINLISTDLSNSSNSSCSEFRIKRKILIKSILREDTNLMKHILSHCDIASIRDKHDNSLMHIACGFGRLKSIQTLMSLCPKSIELFNKKGHNPIDVAIKVGLTT